MPVIASTTPSTAPSTAPLTGYRRTRLSAGLSRRGALAAAATAVLALSACSAGATQTTSDTNASAAGGGEGELFASVQTMFGQVDIPQPADGELTVVALGWSDAEAALAMGVQPVAVYDWLGYGEENKGVGPWAQQAYGDVTPTVIPRTDGDIDYELVQSLEPDLILNVNSAGEEAQYDRLSQIAPTVFGPEGSAGFTVGWRNGTTLIGQALGRAEEGAALVEQTEATIAAAAQAHPEFASLTGVSGSKFGEAYGANLTGDFRWDLLADLGFTLNPAVAELTAQGFYAPVSVEQVSVFDADVAVLLPIGYTQAELQADPLLSALSVVQQGRAVVLDPDGDLASAFSAANVLSIPVAVEGMTPLLAEAAAKAA